MYARSLILVRLFFFCFFFINRHREEIVLSCFFFISEPKRSRYNACRRFAFRTTRDKTIVNTLISRRDSIRGSLYRVFFFFFSFCFFPLSPFFYIFFSFFSFINRIRGSVRWETATSTHTYAYTHPTGVRVCSCVCVRKWIFLGYDSSRIIITTGLSLAPPSPLPRCSSPVLWRRPLSRAGAPYFNIFIRYLRISQNKYLVLIDRRENR